MREKSIYGKYVDVICLCGYEKHPGALNQYLLRKKHCIAKKCPYMKVIDGKAYEFECKRRKGR